MTNKVYLMKDGPTGWYKIGKSITPVKRERTLLAQQPMIDLLCYWEDEQDAKERFLHAQMNEFRRRGEWFELSKKEIWQIYWLMRDHRRTDVHEDAKQYAHEYREREWHFAAMIGEQNRYPHLTWKSDWAVPQAVYAPAYVGKHTSMEWATDGQEENVPRNNFGHPDDLACKQCNDFGLNMI